MRYKEKVGYIALGGLLMLLGMLVSRLTPLGAQSGVDSNFGEITCTGLKVVDAQGRLRVWLSPGSFMGGNVFVYGDCDDGEFVGAGLAVGTHGGLISVYGKVAGCASMGIDEHGGRVFVFEESSGAPRAAMTINKYGHGAVSIHPRESTKSRVVMTANEYGRGKVSIFDESGYREATLK